MNYFLYARKSTDDKDKQVHSIEDQVAVLRKLAKKEGFNIVQEFEERQTAKVPGRPIFSDMLRRIEKGEAQGILCWKIDRLARNPVDAAQIQWLLQRGTVAHIQTYDRSWYGNRMHKDRITFILSNIFYYGHFRYKGEVHEGKHTPIVEKSLFDKVQKVLVRRGHPQAETSNPQPLCGLLSCGECGMSITAEVRVKYQKNGNVHQYVYYRCTKKSAARCAQPYVRQESLSADLSK